MFSIKRNQVIITALVVMICVAGYLNYIDTKNASDLALEPYNLTSDGDISAIVLDSLTGQEVSVIGGYNGETAIENTYPASAPASGLSDMDQDPNAQDIEPGTAVFVNASSDTSFFVQAKLNREQDRSRQKDTLSGLIGSNEIDQDTKALCADAILAIAKRMDNESAAEAALVAKGFGESYVRIDDSWVEVIINKHVITDQELAQLEDIVTRTTGMAVSQIRLSSVKAN